MTLATGTRLGVYEILAPLGAGGMGEVYRARDSRLKREVAIKILPDVFANDAERLARFEREAEVLAALNHPHIAHIHGVEESGGLRALVMELVEGEDLGQIVARGPIPIEEVLPIARQIAEALEAAHERGIIHRDLKPANIKIRADGTVKVLDFGLAKALEQGSLRQGSGQAGIGDQGSGGYADSLANSPTITSPAMTVRGTILGTASYMAPEQAKGKTVDRRADIWAFGCVLFEMLTGRRTFAGESVAEVIAAVIKEKPDLNAMPAGTPDSIRRLLTRCLEKDPKQRLHDAGDARLEIEEAISSPVHSDSTVAGGNGRMRRRERVAWATTALLALIAATVGILAIRSPSLWQRELAAPTRTSLVQRNTMIAGAPQISPDGRRVVYVARDPGGSWSLWVRELDAAEPRRLAATTEFDNIQQPFWSPDSKSIGYFAPQTLLRISASGGSPQKLADIGYPKGGTWSPSGVILYSPDDNVGLFSIPEKGGSPQPVTTLPKEGTWEHSWPTFLPDGRRFLFTGKPINRPFEASEAGIYVGSLDTTEVHRLLPDVSSALYSPAGYILFLREGVLSAVPFDASSARLTGEVVSLGEKVTTNAGTYLASMSIADNNMLALRQAMPFDDLGQVRWVDRQGTAANIGSEQTYFGGTASPDGRFAAVTINDVKTGSADIWILDDAGNARQLTTSREWEGYPVWSADGKRIAYSATRESGAAVLIRDLDGGEPTMVHESREGALLPRSWSADGRYLLVNRVAVRGRTLDIFVLSLETGQLAPYLDSPAAEFLGSFSPDGRFVAYMSNEGGPTEAWVAAFPTPNPKRRIATRAGPVGWSADGKEILVWQGNGDVSAVPVTISQGQVVAGPPTVIARGIRGVTASPNRDHSRLLTLVRPDPEQGVAEIQLLSGWLDKVRR